MKFVTMIVAFGVVSEDRAIAQAEWFAILLTKNHAISTFSGAVTNAEFIRICEGFDRRAELFGGVEVQIFIIVGVLGVGFSTRGLFCNRNRTVQCPTKGISASAFCGYRTP